MSKCMFVLMSVAEQ